MLTPNSRSFRQWFGSFVTGVTVVTARHPDQGAMGITINSLTSVSLKPPLILFCLDRNAHIYPLFRNVKLFAVNILGDAQEEISRHFADFRHHPEPKKVWGKPQEDCPVLLGTLGWMICRKTATYKAGDHDILVGEALKLKKHGGDLKPLLYFRSRYRQILD